ncbi:MAG: hypothetical protein WC581_10330 [Thermodesulfovibrionales bacterium]
MEINFEDKRVKYILAALGTIFLGAIGSGLWERFLGPFSDRLILFIVDLFSSISNSYLNSLYRKIGYGNKEIFSYQVYSIIMPLYSVTPWVLILCLLRTMKKLGSKLERKKEDKEEIENLDKFKKDSLEKLKRLKKIVYFGLFPVLLLSSLITISQFMRNLFEYKAVVYVERSIEMVAPKISGQQYLELRALYRAVDTKEKFLLLQQELIKYSKANGVNLPDFKLVD